MQLELTHNEVDKLIEILNDKYKTSMRLLEISTIKSILQKMGVKIEDWIPELTNI